MTDLLVVIIIAVAAGFVFYKLRNSAKTGKCSGGCGCSCDDEKKSQTNDSCCK